MIARHLIWDIFYNKFCHHRAGYVKINDATWFERIMIPPMETIAFLMQLSALIAIPILLAFTEVNFKTTNKYMTVYILIPVTLTVISVVWSGWIQNYLVESKTNKAKTDARTKSGNYLVESKSNKAKTDARTKSNKAKTDARTKSGK